MLQGVSAKRLASHRDALQFRIAAAQTRRRVILTNERKYSRSKFHSEEKHLGASRPRRGVHTVTDRRRCYELDLIGRQNSPDRRDNCVLGHLSGSRIFYALLRDCLRPIATGIGAAKRDVRAEARRIFAGITLAPGE